ncbi:GyrI-like domain-containing protein [Aldersonia kunmingensis]|uniref:GyrI-like domain-containing protein n=1 Tax=Aldersonia kunmingensis TaxID=408066 RepID=UPI00083562D6|nr:GyrI-like domain-containing protein [Aldersonia kunmingensis]
MEFAIVERPEILIAGTVLRAPALLATDTSRRDRLQSMWERTLGSDDLPGPPGAAYVDYDSDLDSYVTHVAGYRCRDLTDLRAGDVLARVPGGLFACFTAHHSDIAVAVGMVWQAVWDAEASGVITRSYTGDFERYPDATTAVGFTAIVDDGRRPVA